MHLSSEYRYVSIVTYWSFNFDQNVCTYLYLLMLKIDLIGLYDAFLSFSYTSYYANIMTV